MALPKGFFSHPTLKVAQDLLGCHLIHDSSEGRTVGRIVETEAYLYRNDPACHAGRGMTKRNAAMFGKAGRSYVYFIYGMYHCFNVVSGPEGDGEAVLIRALEPLEGVELMQSRRKRTELTELCSGPAKLVLAMGIGPQHNGKSLLRGEPLKLYGTKDLIRGSGEPIISTERVGISVGTELPYRFFFDGNRYISRK